MQCPACDEKITDGCWMCPFCEHIVDASFLGNDITNDVGWGDGLQELPEMPPDAPTDGLEVDQQMIVSSLEDDELEEADDFRELEPDPPDPRDPADPPDPPTDDIGPVVRELPGLGIVQGPEDKIDTKPLPDEMLPGNGGLKPLDPSLLQELDEPPELAEPAPMTIERERSESGARSSSKRRGLPPVKRAAEPLAEEAEHKKREVLTRAIARGPIQERRSTAGIPPKREVDIIIRNSKAEKIFEQALEDMQVGNVISARTNIKLALSFDPRNERYMAKLAEVEQEAGPIASQDLEEIPKGTQFANQFYEGALDQENQGNFEDAIRLLEKAIRADPQGVYYHRLGVILAFNQGKLKEGRAMVDKAIQKSPRNKNYQKTLSRILEKMGLGEERRNMADMIGGLLKRK